MGESVAVPDGHLLVGPVSRQQLIDRDDCVGAVHLCQT